MQRAWEKEAGGPASRTKSWRTLYAAGEFTFCFDDKGEALVLSRQVP